MPPPRQRPPFAADGRTHFVGWLDRQRSIVHWKCEDMSDLDTPRPVLPTSPLTTATGVISHLRWTEKVMVEETARHAGYLEAVRELLDGTKGYY